MPELRIHGLRFAWPNGGDAERGPAAGDGQPILDIDELTLESGAHLCLRGASGSGKTTFLNILSGIMLPRQGKVMWDDLEPAGLPEAERDRWRGRHVGFVFQDFRLFDPLSALDNVLLPATFHAFSIPGEVRGRARELLDGMGIAKDRRAGRLSRGEKQRVAIARAVLLRPEILLADEPTASLDRDSAALVTDLLRHLAHELGSTLIIVSHDRTVLERMPRVLTLERGRLAPQGASS